ncbi:hypothetical protein D1831_08595 [Lactiplantibacillus garii]|uniref:Uncharacterized protein n=1 Tax=Lactiplantibacillus garii TaxID=2306423 RepID=A0A3R8KE55_9LACO|nr:hypothetical protein [Lactiplantibacillus garii]RRK10210.1 hypothetical protein D1831_08595 [Lactiplantibacillus garii]
MQLHRKVGNVFFISTLLIIIIGYALNLDQVVPLPVIISLLIVLWLVMGLGWDEQGLLNQYVVQRLTGHRVRLQCQHRQLSKLSPKRVLIGVVALAVTVYVLRVFTLDTSWHILITVVLVAGPSWLSRELSRHFGWITVK